MKNNLPLEKLNIFSFRGVQMRTFHITWMTFFVCFFGWFGLAPLMPTIKETLHLTKPQIGNIIIASVSGTIIARLLIGRLCDTWGPRKTYTALLIVGAIPVMCVGLAESYSSFLLFRLAISIVGASFVITQFHTSMMFSPAIKGTANAVAGGWGNLGGGITNMLMPVVFTAIVGFGYVKADAWRYAMILPGVMMLLMAFVYFKFTKDTPAGNYDEIDRDVQLKSKTDFTVLKDWRVWALALAYAVCFGMEITFDNVAALHFVQEYNLTQSSAGFWAGAFGFMNIFARALGGIFADRVGRSYGMRGKGLLLASVLLLEGVGLLLFANAGNLPLAILSMITFALFLKMANGATYAITPFVNTKNVGFVSGVVGAGGNVGGMLFGFLFKSESITYMQAFGYIGMIVIAVSAIIFVTRFSEAKKALELTVA
ncbi:NarK family nitrate/nitrite MFS transporter [Aquirufa antheringensis]|uniref:NarK family nitrate/nitrite MFS transporter n=1 Tax=Aquirufa antheringensis TaxID=2516559 RepID=UPI001032CB5C|nr:NarK family nitrate/nitrite MFS transporter [Aquirufa antheringensis]MCE4216775.1 NarK family nitrate/nitrite MFS transporter [Pseudarcicella sp. GAP-15]MCL9968855.1 NarK family nitrate/nitrite MFS transporter [Aquirufa antheringensis]MCZ2476514.1 NarK family nitrate/nitrite MFS transporter [Aquirufa antheringensis]TBH69741.1 NarK family nitrate/nitrite MFS transporter [Aquirufa antheringensis]